MSYDEKDVAWLISAAERVKRYLQAQIDGKYFAPNEDICAGRELADALRAINGDTNGRAAAQLVRAGAHANENH